MAVSSSTLNLFSLASHCIHAAIMASTPIQSLQRQCRMKEDGTLVTDADGAAQYIIYSELRSVHSGIRIVGEESDMEMQAEENRRRQNSSSTFYPQANTLGHDQKRPEENGLSHPASSYKILLEQLQEIMKEHSSSLSMPSISRPNIDEATNNTIKRQKFDRESIEYQRVSVFVDPLDGTSSYAKGEYEVVTILIAIIVDNFPVFGVIVKPFQAGIELETFRDTGCSVIYGGSLIGGAFTIGKDGCAVELERSRQFRLYGNRNTNRSLPHESFGQTTAPHVLFQRSNEIIGRKRQEVVDNELNHDNNDDNTLQTNSGKRCKMENLPCITEVAALDQAKQDSNHHNQTDTHNNHKRSMELVATATNKSKGSNDVDIQSQQASESSFPLSSNVSFSSSSCNRQLDSNAEDPSPTSHSPTDNTSSSTTATTSRHDNLLRAIISKSRSGGIVQKCINDLSSQNLLHPQPIYITGAGYKTMKLVIGQDNEGLWFFPKPGTSLWDVAAADALLRVIGGRISDRYGKDLDYQKGRLDAENIHGIIACIDEFLHTKCVALCLKEKWDDVQERS